MLELRPSCENCKKQLPPNSTEAMICTYECTFCKDCVDSLLENVCPNCGGNFVPRPIRPQNEYIKNTSLIYHPASTKIVYKKVLLETFNTLKEQLKNVIPEKR